MNKELAISSQQFGFIFGIFFFGYFLFDIPSNLLLHQIGARVRIARMLLTWRLVAMLTGFVPTVRRLYIARFVLGLADGESFPGVLLYLSYRCPVSRPASARVCILVLIYFGIAVAIYAMNSWAPQLVRSLSSLYSNSMIALLVTIPSLVGLAAMILVSRSSDRTLERRYHVAIPALVTGTALVLLGTTPSAFFSVALFCLLAAGVFCCLSLFWAFLGQFFSGLYLPAV